MREGQRGRYDVRRGAAVMGRYNAHNSHRVGLINNRAVDTSSKRRERGRQQRGEVREGKRTAKRAGLRCGEGKQGRAVNGS